MLVTLFDTETTGLIKNTAKDIRKQPRIIEFYAMTLQQTGEGEDATFSFVDELDLLINPGIPITTEITRITGITGLMVAGSLAFPALAGNIQSYLSRAHRIVAHNLDYDRTVTDIELKRCGKSMVWPELLCTVEATEHLKGFRLKLTDLHEYLFGEPFEGAHRAKVDVTAMARCYTALVAQGVI